MSSRYKDIIFLLGAGASAEAGIPTSGAMIKEIEELLNSHSEWKPFTDLYHHIKSAIHYAAGLRGEFNDAVSYNIEILVNTLYELERNESHPLYPFIASWNARFLALAGERFANVEKFRKLILKKLKSWVSPDATSLAKYYEGFVKIRQDLNFPLHIFSLNYDRCVEELDSRGQDFRVETGFEGFDPRYTWSWERFEESEAGPPPPEIYLYKLHGSINWKRKEITNELFAVQHTESIDDPDKMEVIFGRDFKLEAADPYLFYAYAFRQFSLRARLIVSIGYGFGDSHINKILTQALKSSADKQLLVLAGCKDDEKKQSTYEKVLKDLSVKEKQIIVKKGTAKEFLETPNLADELIALIPKAEDEPF
jgi:hypothetical protein